MKLKFKVQPYQIHAVDSDVDCFAGQAMVSGINYRTDPGRRAQTNAFEEGLKNVDLALSEATVLANMQDVQRRMNLPFNQNLAVSTVVNARGGRHTNRAT